MDAVPPPAPADPSPAAARPCTPPDTARPPAPSTLASPSGPPPALAPPGPGAGLQVLFVGGTGTISASCVRRAVDQGMEVAVLNRGTGAMARALPAGVERIRADVRDTRAVTAALVGRRFDAVVNFLTFTPAQAADAVTCFAGRTDHYVHISTASMYRKPLPRFPVTESTARRNPHLAYARAKIEAEDVFLAAWEQADFPATIVRPSHTYDEAAPPLPGGWTVVDRIARGAPMVVHGDGTSLWTLTHAADFAVGLVGLLGRASAAGEAFHITSADVLTWDGIYTIVARALGVEPVLRHLPSEFFVLAEPEWDWSELLMGDLGHSAVFDTSKIRSWVPAFAPERTFEQSVPAMLAWRRDHPDLAAPDPQVQALYDRMAGRWQTTCDLFRPEH